MQLKYHSKAIIVLLAIVSLSSCDPPKSLIKSHPFITMTDDKGQANVALTFGGTRIEALAAYSPIKHLEFRAQGYGGSLGDAYEFSLGAYARVTDVRLGLYAGYGEAMLHQIKRNGRTYGSGNDDPTFRVDGYQKKWFIQPEVGLYTSDQFSVGFSCRISRYDYKFLEVYKQTYSGSDPSGPEDELFKGSPSGILKEPLIFLQLRVLPVHQFTAYVGIVADDFLEVYPDYTPFILSLTYGVKIGAGNRQKLAGDKSARVAH